VLFSDLKFPQLFFLSVEKSNFFAPLNLWQNYLQAFLTQPERGIQATFERNVNLTRNDEIKRESVKNLFYFLAA